MLSVKQTQKIEGRVGLFRVPVEVEITTARDQALQRYRSRTNRLFLTWISSVDGPFR